MRIIVDVFGWKEGWRELGILETTRERKHVARPRYDFYQKRGL